MWQLMQQQHNASKESHVGYSVGYCCSPIIHKFGLGKKMYRNTSTSVLEACLSEQKYISLLFFCAAADC